MECIILAGGLGTRLRGVIGEQPKCMAPVNGKPFLDYLFQYLAAEGCRRVVLSLGYKHEVILDWYKQHTWPFEIDYVVEEEPLGTGGGIQLALQAAKADHVLVLNGDTLFQVRLEELLRFHQAQQAMTTLALKPMQEFDRYGVVRTDEQHRISGFEEKKYMPSGTINGGIYAIDRVTFLAQQMPERFSFEKDYLEAYVQQGQFYGYESNAYFIDIGIPADYEQAQTDFKALFK